MSDIYLVIMAGGSGTRFWPKSTSSRPKQLIGFGKRTQGEPSSLILQTLDRFEGWVEPGHRMIVTTRKLQESMQKEVDGRSVILAEPSGRNTAPCVFWAAKEIYKKNKRAVMMVMPADHFMSHPKEFLKTVKQAAEWAKNHDDLVTLGVKPTRPETGYGYLKLGKPLDPKQGVARVDSFVEKPNLSKAEEFVRSENYLWNGGMFLWRVDVILKAFETYMPEMEKIWQASKENVELAYPQLTPQSIDYGIMEKAKNVVTFSLDCGWDDVGSWTSLEGLAQMLGAWKGSNVVTSGDCVSIDSEGNIVDAPQALVALLGVKDLIVVKAGETLLVADKSRAQDIKILVDEVKKEFPQKV